jgi:integrase
VRNEHWRWRPLGELFEIGSGKTMSAAARSGVEKTPFLRTSNVRWDEIDLKAKMWTIPAERMKMGKPHKVPLTDRVLSILHALPREDGNQHVFIGPTAGKGLSNMAMNALLRRMQRGDITVHGMRSSFMDWCHDRTAFPKVVIDMALAHAVGDKVEAAYRRGDLLAKRKQLMQAWEKYCASTPMTATATEGNVVVALRSA